MQYVAGLIAIAIGGSLIFGWFKILYLHFTKKDPIYDGSIIGTLLMLIWAIVACSIFLRGAALVFDFPKFMMLTFPRN